MVQALRVARVFGRGARLVEEKGVMMVYSKWVRTPKGVEPGELVVVENERGDVLGCAFYDTVGPVALRMLSLGDCPFSTPREAIVDRIEKALELRKRIRLATPGKAYRLVHSDGDMLPGLIIDVYDDLVVYQSSSSVWDKYADVLVDAIEEVLGGGISIYEKSTQRTRLEIGLEPREGLRRGNKAKTVVEEGAVKLVVDPRRGQKTGLFLDQRDNRLLFEGLVPEGAEVLDAFSYTGGFGLHALARGARRVVFIEQDEKAVELLRENLELNGFSKSMAEVVVDNAWSALRRLRAARQRFDAVIVDPPAFITSREVKSRGIKAYRRLYRSAVELVKVPGLVFLSSCSAFLEVSEFEQLVAEALSGSDYTVVGGVRGMPLDHPCRPSAPHLSYLKSLFALLHSIPRKA